MLFGGGVYPDHVLQRHAHFAPGRPPGRGGGAGATAPPPLANLCQAAVASEITDDNVFEMLVFADDRQLADLRTECLKHAQRRWNSNLSSLVAQVRTTRRPSLKNDQQAYQAPTTRCKRRP